MHWHNLKKLKLTQWQPAAPSVDGIAPAKALGSDPRKALSSFLLLKRVTEQSRLDTFHQQGTREAESLAGPLQHPACHPIPSQEIFPCRTLIVRCSPIPP